MARTCLLATLAAVAALAAAAPATADAAACVKPGLGSPSARGAEVIFDGVVLSGPRLGVTGDVLSPARLQVVRYLKGHGPRIVRVATSFAQGAIGRPTGTATFTPEPGEVLRIFGRTPRGAGSSAARGVLEPAACDGFQVLKPGRYLHVLSGTSTRARSNQGGAPWVASPLGGPRSLRCVRFQPANKPAGVDRQAECLARPGPRALLLGVASTSQGASTTTAVVVAARTLRSVSIESPDGTVEVKALGRGLPMAVAVFSGFVDPTQLEIHATFRGGGQAEAELASRRADAPDPGGQGAWAVYGADAYPRVKGGICASFWQPLPRFRDLLTSALPTESCGKLGRAGYWFDVQTTYGTPPPGAAAPVTRTVVSGAIGARVASIAVSAGGIAYPVAIARFGRAFLSVLPAGATPTLAFRMRDGSTRTYTGRTSLGVMHRRAGAL
ncbi:MAG: hypothetical protein ACJ77M_18065 [Thermoleophilaceae bacterium]